MGAKSTLDPNIALKTWNFMFNFKLVSIFPLKTHRNSFQKHQKWSIDTIHFILRIFCEQNSQWQLGIISFHSDNTEKTKAWPSLHCLPPPLISLNNLLNFHSNPLKPFKRSFGFCFIFRMIMCMEKIVLNRMHVPIH